MFFKLNNSMKIPIISFLTSILLVLSIVYDFSYLSALNLSFSQVPTSISDHIRSSLLWAPVLFLGLFVSLTFELVSMRIEKGMSEEEIINSSPNPKIARKIRNSPENFLIFIVIFTAIFIFISYIFGIINIINYYTLMDWKYFFMALWIVVFEWIFTNERINKKFSKEFFLIFLVFGAMLIYVFFQGKIDAKKAFSKPQNVYFKLKNNEFIEKKFLRNFENFFLVYDKSTKNIEIILKSEIIYFGFKTNKKK